MAILVATAARFIEFGEERGSKKTIRLKVRGISKTQTIQGGSGM